MANIASGAVNGEDYANVTAVTGVTTYAVLPSDQLIQVTTATSTVKVNLPTPTPVGTFNSATMRPDQSTSGQTGNVGQTVRVEKIDTGNGTVIVHGAMNIGVDYLLANRWSQATLVCDGVRWNLVGTVS